MLAFALVLGMTACGPAVGQTVTLTCDVAGGAAQALCDALRGELQRRGYREEDGAAQRITLTARLAQPHILSATLDVAQGGRLHRGKAFELSVMDRADILTAQIDDFARLLVDQSALSR